MVKGYKNIFWGVFIATFNINLAFIKILPAFIGWIIVHNGIIILMEEFKTQSFEKAIKYSKYLIVLSIIGEFLSLFAGISINSIVLFSYFPVVTAIIELLMIFYIIDGSIEYFKEIEEEIYATQYEINLKTYTIFFVIEIILMCIGLMLNNILLTIAVILAIILRISVMVMINNLKKLYINHIWLCNKTNC